MRRSRSALAAVTLAALLAACGDDGPSSAADERTTTAADDVRPYPVASFEARFVDQSRPTVRADGTQVAPDRTLDTLVWYPEGADGPAPLITLAHGYTGHPDLYDEQLGPAWAAAGYVVAAPRFPLTNRDTPGGAVLGDYREQPADVSFVLDEVLALADDPESPLHGLVDAERIGVAGHSLGGVTAFAVGYHTCCRNERVDALMVFAAIPGAFDGTHDPAGPPLLLILADRDDAVAYDRGVAAYEAQLPPKYLVTVLGGAHSPPFEDAPDPADEAVEQITLDFWDGYLAGDAAALDDLLVDGDQPGLTTVEHATT